MTDDDTGHDLTDRLGGLLANEPPFEMNLAQALDAAQEGGRRRRTLCLAIRGGSALLTVAAVAVLFSAWPEQSSPVQPAHGSNVTVTPRATVTGSPTATNSAPGTSGPTATLAPTGTRGSNATTTSTPQATATRSPAGPTAQGSSSQGPTATSSQRPSSRPTSSFTTTMPPSPSTAAISTSSSGDPTRS